MIDPSPTQSATPDARTLASSKRDTGGKKLTSSGEKICLLVLGMHRSGTSALTRTMNMLGYALPDRLIGALEGNETGHWEPENIVLFNDRLLADMRSSWHDFRSLPATRLGPAEMRTAQAQIIELLEQEYGHEPYIILKDPRVCRFAPIYMQALEVLGYQVVPIISFRSPAEVIRSLQKRRSNWPEGFGAPQAALMWLRHVLDAEFNSRGMQRSFSEYSAFLKDWQSEVSRIAQQGNFHVPERIELVAPLIEEFLRPDLRHEKEGSTEISGEPVLRGWCHKAHDALRKLVVTPDSASAMEALDRIRIEFDAAELSLSDLSNSSVEIIRSASQRLRSAEQDNSEKLKLLKAGDEEITRLRQRIEGQDVQLAELNTLNQEAHAELKAARERIEGQDVQLAELNALNQEAQAELKAARERIEEQDAQLRELSRSLVEAREEATSQAAELLKARQRIEGQDAKIAELNGLFHDRNLHIDRLRLQAKQLEHSFLSSRSWRVTAPLRKGGRILHAARKAGRSFTKLSATKGGLAAGTGVALRILVKEGPKGLRARIHNPNNAPWAARELPASIDPTACFIVATQHVMSFAQMMAQVLREEGYSVTIRTDLEGADLAAHVFVICPQMFENVPDDYIAIQMEQSVSSRWFTQDYFDRLNRARAIIDYSTTNLRFLRDNNLPLYKLHYVPLDVDSRLIASHKNPRSGILFYGDDKCPRRQKILNAVQVAYPELKIATNLFGDALEQELRQAAVVLNIHYYENALLETTRIYQALSCGTPVVSEEASDQSEHKILNGIVDFAPVDDVDRIIELLRPYVEGGAGAERRLANIAAFTQRKDNRFEMFFRRFLLSQRMIGYDAFLLRAPSYPIELDDTVQLCLSLPETPERRDLFLKQEQKGFQIWDGLKATPGWVGAALSYRHMFERIIGSGAERALVCEDDVLFPPDFDNRLAVVERYLKNREWDIFSGFITDAHADLNVTHVEEFEGQTFVHVDRTVSMVFNIYNREIMEFLAKWDLTNFDVNSNTIDRYLEGHGSTRVILTLPFLVGHRPEASSTIWGFENTQYNEVVEQSEIRLAEKVADFKKRMLEHA